MIPRSPDIKKDSMSLLDEGKRMTALHIQEKQVSSYYSYDTSIPFEVCAKSYLTHLRARVHVQCNTGYWWRARLAKSGEGKYIACQSRF